MKNLVLLSSVLFLFASCKGDDGCNCSEARWQRTAEYSASTGNLVASTDWNMQGVAQPISSTDCSYNGTLGDHGVVSSETLTNGNTKKIEYEYRVSCQ